jgi:hypothetical protein
MRLMSLPFCLFVTHNLVAGQRLGKHIPAETNIHATIEELLDVIFPN